MNHTATEWADRLRRLRRHLNRDQDEMGRDLGISREWVSKLEREREGMSELVQRRLADLERAHGFTPNEPRFTPHLKSGGLTSRVGEDRPASSGAVASRLPLEKRMPSRADCEDYLQRILDAAEAEGSPENMPAIFHRLKKQFPLDEWLAPPPEERKP